MNGNFYMERGINYYKMGNRGYKGNKGNMEIGDIREIKGIFDIKA